MAKHVFFPEIYYIHELDSLFFFWGGGGGRLVGLFGLGFVVFFFCDRLLLWYVWWTANGNAFHEGPQIEISPLFYCWALKPAPPESHTFATKLAFWCHDLMFPDILITGSYFGALSHTIRWDHDQAALNHAWEAAVCMAAKEQKESEAALCHIYIHLSKSPALLSILSCKLHDQGLLPACPMVEMPSRPLTEGQFLSSHFLPAQNRALCESGWTFCKRVLWLWHVSSPLSKTQHAVTIYLCHREERPSLIDQLHHLQITLRPFDRKC